MTSTRFRSRRSRASARDRAFALRSSTVRSGSVMAVDSVISTVTRVGSMPATIDGRDDLVDQLGLPQLSWGQVEADLQGEALGPPLASWRQISSTTQSPIASIRPISSAKGMNSPGETSPPFGSGHRISASTPTIFPVVQLDDRLVVKHPLLHLDRFAQPGRHRQPAHRVGILARVHDVAAGSRSSCS